MRVLWLTRAVPYPPNYGGDYRYTARLIEAVAEAGAEVTVLCADAGGAPPSGPAGVEWHVVPAVAERPAWRSALSPRPVMADRFATPARRAAFAALLGRGSWDAVVFDHLRTGWLLALLLRQAPDRASRPAIVYVSHNHEEQVSRDVADAYRGNPLVRLALALDSVKVRRLERRLVAAADLVGTNTEADAAAYRRYAPALRYVLLTPAYDGPLVPPREVRDLPRRAVILGSYGWIAKQINLRAFLAVAAPRFAARGVELHVVGMLPAGFAREMRSRFSTVVFSGTVPDVGPLIANARLGLIPEEVGGGFKNKALDYVFHRIPIAAIAGTLEGAPLVAGESVLEFSGMAALAEGALDVIDDDARLERLAAAAFAACEGRFEWADRGRALAAAIRALRADRVGRDE